MSKIGYIILIVSVLISCSPTEIMSNCPEKELYDFDQKVDNEETAKKLFKEFFSEEQGYPPFDDNKVYSPTENIDRYMKDKYVYDNRYGANGVGGVLYQNGRLVRYGHCK